jgi:hypothetical protein
MVAPSRAVESDPGPAHSALVAGIGASCGIWRCTAAARGLSSEACVAADDDADPAAIQLGWQSGAHASRRNKRPSLRRSESHG